MHRILPSIFVVSLLALLALAAWVLHVLVNDPTRVSVIKTALFTSRTDSRSHFTASPSEMLDRGFATDDNERISAWRERLKSEVPFVAAIDEQALPENAVERAQAITLAFSKNGDEFCGAPSLMHNLQRMKIGEGCCTDFSEVFLALASILGLETRETRQTRHTHSEIYDDTDGRWIWIDPYYAIMARDPDGRYLSLMEMRDRYLDGKPFEYEFFGTDEHTLANAMPYEEPFYEGSWEVEDIYIVLGNNVFEQDDFRARIHFLPKPVWQLLGMMTGVVPGYMIYSDPSTTRPEELRRIRVTAIALVSGIGVGLLAYPLSFLLRLVRTKTSGPGPAT
jgi:hypothetical protein